MAKVFNFPAKEGAIFSVKSLIEMVKEENYSTLITVGFKESEHDGEEGTIFVSSNNPDPQLTAKDFLLISELLRFMALKELKFI